MGTGAATWWVAIAPLLAFLFDALLGGLARRRLFAEAIWRTTQRTTFVVRSAPLSEQGRSWILQLWMAGAAAAVFVAVDALGYTLLRDEGRLVARTALIFLLLGVRRLARAALHVGAAVEADALPVAQEWARAMGASPSEAARDPILRSATQRVGRGYVEAALLPLIWAGLLGPGGAAFAAATRELVRYSHRHTTEGVGLFEVARRLDRGLASVAASVGLVAVALAVRALGGRDVLRHWTTGQALHPEDRLVRAISLSLPATEDAGADLARWVVLLWVVAGLGAVLSAALSHALAPLW